MKKIFIGLAAALSLSISGCTKEDIAADYYDPSKVTVTNVPKQFSGFLIANKDYTIPSYWNYFVILRTSVNRYTQAVGWENLTSNQYVPGAASITDRWNSYYNFVAQFRILENVYSKLSATEQKAYRVYMIAATIFFYDHTQRVIDLHGDIPWTEAGKLYANNGDYPKSFAKYEDATAIYTKMLDDLKGIADELNTFTVSNAVLTGFKTQDIINNGDLTLWKKYCNSLRVRLLSRASATMTSRASTELAQILADPAKYPVVLSNSENIQVDIYSLDSDINSKGFQSGLEDWNGNIASKPLIDLMSSTTDPRLRAVFEPGEKAGGVYRGLDQQLPAADQNALIAGGTLSIYNRSTISRNQYFPGVIMNAAEVNFYAAEAQLKAGNDAAAKAAYENGIKQSIDFYYSVRKISNNTTSPELIKLGDNEVATYLANKTVAWTGSATDKLNLIATQKWLHYNVIQPLENWAEVRRLNAPALTFPVDNASQLKQPPARWVYPSAEAVYNTANYEAVKSKDVLTNPVFWDK